MREQISSQQTARARLRRQQGSIAKKLTGPLEDVDARVTISALILGFWGLFWGLNGLAKLLSGEHVVGVMRQASVTIGASGLAGALPYVVSVVELVLGLSFLYTLFFSRWAPMLSRLNFRLSLLIFLAFATADMLLASHGQLWEHGAWLALVIVSSYLYRPEGSKSEAD